jgi:hypothetical protein
MLNALFTSISKPPNWQPPQQPSSPRIDTHPKRISLKDYLIQMSSPAGSPASAPSPGGDSNLGSTSLEHDMAVKEEHLDDQTNQEDFSDADSAGAMTNGAASPDHQPLASVEAPAGAIMAHSAAPEAEKTTAVRSGGAESAQAEQTPRPSASSNDPKTKLWRHVLR